MKKLLFSLIALVLIIGAGFYLMRNPIKLSGLDAGAVKAEKGTPVYSAIVGKWKNNEDAETARQFNEDGTFSDFFRGDPAGAPGTWELVLGHQSELYELRLHSEGDTMLFRVMSLTPESLDLRTEKGDILKYSKVK